MRLVPQWQPTIINNYGSGGGGSTSSLPADWVSVTDFGALGDGVTDDSAAFLLARDTGANVYIPSGIGTTPKNYIISQTIKPKYGQEWKMGGVLWGLYDANTPWATRPTMIIWNNTTQYCFDMESSSRLDNIRIIQNGTPTAGGHFHIGNSSYRIYGAQLHQCASYGAWNGYALTDMCGHNVLTENVSNACIHSGYEIDLASPNGDLRWTANTSLQDIVGVRVRQCDTSKIMGMTVKAAFQCSIYLMADHGTIDQLSFIGADLEDVQGGYDNVVIFGGNGNSVTRCNFTGVEILGSLSPSGCGIILMQSNASDNTINIPMGMYCRYKDYGTRNKLINSTFMFTSTLTAIDIYGTDALVANNVVDGFYTGVQIEAGANYTTVVGNNCRSSTYKMLFDSAAKATGRGVGNIGVTDW